jgi:DNA-binding NarL/FixJ family response regulator
MMNSRILIWSNQPAFVKAMRSLANRGGLQVTGIARSAEAALRCVQTHRPDVVLVDRQTEERHPDIVVRLMVEGRQTKVIAMDLVDEAAVVLQAWHAPASTIRDLMRVIEGSLASQAA